MRRIAIVLGVVTVVLGAVVVVLGPDDDAAGTPEVAHVICGPDGVRVVGPEVRARPDGVHVRVDNPGRAVALELRPVDGGPADVVETQLAPGRPTDAVLSIEPGRALVACVLEGSSFLERTGELTVRDDAELWVSPDLGCTDPRSLELETFVLEEPAEDTARRAVKGLLDTDVLRKPGYPATMWQGDLLIVERGGATIATIARGQNHGHWAVFVDACPGHHLAEGENDGAT